MLEPLLGKQWTRGQEWTPERHRAVRVDAALLDMMDIEVRESITHCTWIDGKLVTSAASAPFVPWASDSGMGIPNVFPMPPAGLCILSASNHAGLHYGYNDCQSSKIRVPWLTLNWLKGHENTWKHSACTTRPLPLCLPSASGFRIGKGCDLADRLHTVRITLSESKT